MTRLLKVLGGIAGAIVLGAIGSGVWEKLLSPALSWLSSTTASLLSSVSGAYEESIYQRAARDTTDLYPIKVAMLILILAGSALVIKFGLRALLNPRLEMQFHKRFYKLVSIQGFTVGLAFLLGAFVSLARIDAASKIKEASLRSVEILRPYAGESVYAQLRSAYYAIESKQDFVAFKARALDEATKAKIKVPLAALSL